MRKKKILFAALTIAALSVGFTACDDAQDLKEDIQQSFYVMVSSLDDAMGTVQGAGQYPSGTQIVIMATANEGYYFQKWHDGNTDNPRTVTVTANVTYTAIFASSNDSRQYYYITVVSDDEEKGTVKGEGNYPAGAKINIMATPNTGFVFQQWDDGNTDNPRTVTVTADATYTAMFDDYCFSGTANGHDYVDLGLPSGLKWATCNVGATKPEEYGNYYAWGETEPKTNYDWSTYKWCNGDYDTLTKYNTESDYGTVDNKTVLDLEDDAARANWGGAWRMPTKDELQELIDNCTYTSTRIQIDGRSVLCGILSSNINDNFIVFPLVYVDGEAVSYYVLCWSSSLDTDYPYLACCALDYHYNNSISRSGEQRCNKQPVRPVIE